MDLAQLDFETGTTTYSGVLPESMMAERATIEDRIPRFQDRLVDPEMAVFVATHETEGIIGYVRAGTNRDGFPEYTGKIFALYIRESRQRQGIGRCLFATAADWLIAKGHDGVCLQVIGELPAKAFYERLGGELIEYKKDEGGVPFSVYGWKDLATLCSMAKSDASS